MAVIRDVMPAFELFQPASIDDALTLLEPARRRRVGAGGRARQLRLAEGSHQAAEGGRRPEPDRGAARHQGAERRPRDRRDDAAHRGRAASGGAREVRAADGGGRAGGLAADPQPGDASAATCRRTRAAGTTAAAGPATAPAATSATPTRRRRSTASTRSLDADRCVAVNPSDTAPALIALDAQMVIRGREAASASSTPRTTSIGPAIDITRMTVLAAGRAADGDPDSGDVGRRAVLLREGARPPGVGLPAGQRGVGDQVVAATTIERDRAWWSTPWRRRPLRLTNVEAAIVGKPRNEETATMAGEMAVEGAQTLRYNGYKVPLMRNLVKRAIRGGGGRHGPLNVGTESLGRVGPHPRLVESVLGVAVRRRAVLRGARELHAVLGASQADRRRDRRARSAAHEPARRRSSGTRSWRGCSTG